MHHGLENTRGVLPHFPESRSTPLPPFPRKHDGEVRSDAGSSLENSNPKASSDRLFSLPPVPPSHSSSPQLAPSPSNTNYFSVPLTECRPFEALLMDAKCLSLERYSRAIDDKTYDQNRSLDSSAFSFAFTPLKRFTLHLVHAILGDIMPLLLRRSHFGGSPYQGVELDTLRQQTRWDKRHASELGTLSGIIQCFEGLFFRVERESCVAKKMKAVAESWRCPPGEDERASGRSPLESPLIRVFAYTVSLNPYVVYAQVVSRLFSFADLCEHRIIIPIGFMGEALSWGKYFAPLCGPLPRLLGYCGRLTEKAELLPLVCSAGTVSKRTTENAALLQGLSRQLAPRGEVKASYAVAFSLVSSPMVIQRVDVMTNSWDEDWRWLSAFDAIFVADATAATSAVAPDVVASRSPTDAKERPASYACVTLEEILAAYCLQCESCDTETDASSPGGGSPHPRCAARIAWSECCMTITESTVPSHPQEGEGESSQANLGTTGVRPRDETGAADPHVGLVGTRQVCKGRPELAGYLLQYLLHRFPLQLRIASASSSTFHLLILHPHREECHFSSCPLAPYMIPYIPNASSPFVVRMGCEKKDRVLRLGVLEKESLDWQRWSSFSEAPASQRDGIRCTWTEKGECGKIMLFWTSRLYHHPALRSILQADDELGLPVESAVHRGSSCISPSPMRLEKAVKGVDSSTLLFGSNSMFLSSRAAIDDGQSSAQSAAAESHPDEAVKRLEGHALKTRIALLSVLWRFTMPHSVREQKNMPLLSPLHCVNEDAMKPTNAFRLRSSLDGLMLCSPVGLSTHSHSSTTHDAMDVTIFRQEAKCTVNRSRMVEGKEWSKKGAGGVVSSHSTESAPDRNKRKKVDSEGASGGLLSLDLPSSIHFQGLPMSVLEALRVVDEAEE